MNNPYPTPTPDSASPGHAMWERIVRNRLGGDDPTRLRDLIDECLVVHDGIVADMNEAFADEVSDRVVDALGSIVKEIDASFDRLIEMVNVARESVLIAGGGRR
jgi:hypothetical protein